MSSVVGPWRVSLGACMTHGSRRSKSTRITAQSQLKRILCSWHNEPVPIATSRPERGRISTAGSRPSETRRGLTTADIPMVTSDLPNCGLWSASLGFNDSRMNWTRILSVTIRARYLCATEPLVEFEQKLVFMQIFLLNWSIKALNQNLKFESKYFLFGGLL
jgi:hypothetical protein